MGGLILRSTHHIKMVPMEERSGGDDQATGLTGFSVKPLRAASIIGMLFALIGFIYGIVIITRKLNNPIVPLGYSSMMAVQFFTSGVIMLLLGIMGEYLGRIYISLNRSPQFVIRKTHFVGKK